MDTTKFNISHEELERMGALSGIDVSFTTDNERSEDKTCADDVRQLLEELGKAAFSNDGDVFARFVADNRARIHELALYSNEVAELVVLGYKFGISAGNAGCMNNLGALYYLGDLVEQDYAKAAELYEMAMDHGCYQSIINLGYIYEYGRTGKRDLEQAYRYYALAAALAPSSEAVYKMGDMYSRGILGKQDLSKAMALWERSFELADGIVELAQPAVRIAKLLIDPEAQKQGIDQNPLRALHLFQQAEIGLRIDIQKNGMTYYQKRLEEAIAGQETARALVEEKLIV